MYEMDENILNKLVENIILEDEIEEEFRQHIETFSRFLSYTNPDYKYNGTYLNQYIDDYFKMSQMLKIKDEKYRKIVMSLIKLGYKFEVLIDHVFFARYMLGTCIDCRYIGIDKERVMSKKIELKFIFNPGEKELCFCKQYSGIDDENLAEHIRMDIKKYLKTKIEENEI